MTLTLLSIDEEEALCRAAWAAKPRAKAGVHIHHKDVAERLTEPIGNRIDYIRRYKPKAEQALRLRLMRPITAAARAEYQKAKAAASAEYVKATATAWAEYLKATATALAEYEKATAPALAEYRKVTDAAHRAVCPTPDCPWSDESIFGGAA